MCLCMRPCVIRDGFAVQTGGVFSEVEFEYYLNEVSEALVSAGVSSVTLTCTDGTGCTAVMGVLPQSPYTLQLQSHSLTGPDGNPITFTFNSCIAHFGRTPTAAALGPGRLVVASPLSGCEPINIHAGNSNELGLHPNSPLFVLIGRGDCSFATKARHAQAAGAHGVIIVDFTPKQKQAPENILDPSSFSMSDDGTGSDISVVATAVSAHAVDVDTNLDLTFSCIVGLRPSSCKSAVKSSSVNGYCSCSATAMSAYEVSTSTTSKDNTVYTVDTVRVELTGGGESIQSGNTQSAISLVTTVLAKLTATTP